MFEEPELNVNDLLSQFPTPVILRPSRRKWMIGLLFMGVLFGLGLFSFLHAQSPFAYVKYSFLMSVGGLGSASSIIMLVSGACLVLDHEGFTVKQPFVNKFYGWRSVTDFAPLVSPVYMPLSSRESRGAGVVFRQANWPAKTIEKAMGYSGAIGDTYGLSAGALVRLMTSWRERALAAEPGGGSPNTLAPVPSRQTA